MTPRMASLIHPTLCRAYQIVSLASSFSSRCRQARFVLISDRLEPPFRSIFSDTDPPFFHSPDRFAPIAVPHPAGTGSAQIRRASLRTCAVLLAAESHLARRLLVVLTSNWLLGRESPCTGPRVCGLAFPLAASVAPRCPAPGCRSRK